MIVCTWELVLTINWKKRDGLVVIVQGCAIRFRQALLDLRLILTQKHIQLNIGLFAVQVVFVQMLSKSQRRMPVAKGVRHFLIARLNVFLVQFVISWFLQIIVQIVQFFERSCLTGLIVVRLSLDCDGFNDQVLIIGRINILWILNRAVQVRQRLQLLLLVELVTVLAVRNLLLHKKRFGRARQFWQFLVQVQEIVVARVLTRHRLVVVAIQ